MFLLCYRHHCDDFWSLINFLHWSLSLKQYFKFSQSSNYFDITMPTMHRSYLISQECLSATICAPHDLSVILTGNRVTHSRGVRLAYLGIWAVWFSDWYSLWAAFLPRSRHHGGPPCLPGHTHLTQQLRLGSALITNTKHWTERPQGWLETPNMSTASQHLRFWELLLLGWIFLAFCTLNLMLGW